jgi:hypothetical protein
VVDIASIQECVVHDEVPDDDTNFLCHTGNIEIRSFSLAGVGISLAPSCVSASVHSLTLRITADIHLAESLPCNGLALSPLAAPQHNYLALSIQCALMAAA